MSIEDQLRDSLHRRAASVQPRPDLDDVVVRTTARERRTRRFLTAALVVALIAGPLAGFAIGRARDEGRTDVATGGGATNPAPASGADAAVSSALPGNQPLEKLFIRTTADGVAIRAYRSARAPVAVPERPACPPTWGTCPLVPPCNDVVETGPLVLGELSTDAAVALASHSVSTPSGDTGVPSATWGTFGIGEGAPARWVIASVAQQVKRVRVSFPGGATDEMEPVDGIALLASQVDEAGTTASATLEALDGSGAVVDRVELTPGGGGMAQASSAGSSSNGSAGSAVASICGPTGPLPSPPSVTAPPPSTLPAPGEQPADPLTARQQVEKAYTTTYDGSKSMGSREGDVEGGDASKIQSQIESGQFAEDVKKSSATVSDVVFTSPTEAAVRYGIDVKGGNHFSGRVGKAVFVDGAWKVAGETLCRDLEELIGLKCPQP